MKTKKTMYCSALTAFFLLLTIQLNAQVPGFQTPVTSPSDLDVGTISSGETTVTTVEEGVLFYNPATNGPSITLTGSPDDVNGIEFSSYEWYTVLSDGTETIVTGETTATLTLSSLPPGYHKFRVYGVVDNGDGTVSCQSSDYQDIILFVLPELTVETTANLNGNPLGYCVDDLPTTPINLSVSGLSADYTGNSNGYAHPTGGDFEVNYAWYATLEGDTSSPIDLSTTTASYDVVLTEPGTYSFFVEVTYAVKTDDGTRDYVVFTDAVEDGEGAPLELAVTPVPGAPTITLSGITD